MTKKNESLPKTARERAGRLLKMAGSLAAQEIQKRLQTKASEAASSLKLIQQAETLVKELGHLKGAAMKLGQMFALEARDYLPEEVCLILDRLQGQVSFLDADQIRAVVREDLKERASDFIFFSEKPIAAASIGQVHEARLPDQKRVAVKIQYPGVRDSIHSDVKSLNALLKTLSVVLGKKVDFQELMQEFSEIFIQETDYLQEAEFTRRYQTFAQSFPSLIIPQVYSPYCSARVLTLSFEPGVSLTQWLHREKPDLEIRTYYGKMILDLYTKEFCSWGLVQTDPNLGNFLFRPEERSLVLLDFGATKAYSMEFRKKYSELIMTVVHEDETKMLQVAEEMNLIHPRESQETKAIFKTLLRESMNPIIQKEYDFKENEYPERMRKLSRELVGSLKFSPPPKDLIFLHRKLSGVFYILRTLAVKLPLTDYLNHFEELSSTR